MAGTFETIASQMGAPIWLIYVILLWTITWKLIALWKSARNKHVVWFIIMGVINTIGILPILYIYVFSKVHHSNFKGNEKKLKGKNKTVSKKKAKKVTNKKSSKTRKKQ